MTCTRFTTAHAMQRVRGSSESATQGSNPNPQMMTSAASMPLGPATSRPSCHLAHLPADTAPNGCSSLPRCAPSISSGAPRARTTRSWYGVRRHHATSRAASPSRAAGAAVVSRSAHPTSAVSSATSTPARCASPSSPKTSSWTPSLRSVVRAPHDAREPSVQPRKNCSHVRAYRACVNAAVLLLPLPCCVLRT